MAPSISRDAHLVADLKQAFFVSAYVGSPDFYFFFKQSGKK